MRLYIVRHGESQYNALKLHQHGAVPLSKLGEQQAKTVAKRFKTIPVDLIISSNYARAKHTAKEIGKVTKKPIIFTSLLQELKRPTEIENKPFDEPEAVKIKRELREHREDPDWHFSDEENFFDFKKRNEEFVSYVKKRKEQNIAVVCHGFVMRVMFGLMMFGSEALTLDKYDHINSFLSLSNTGICVFELKNNDQWHLVCWNDHAHLGEIETKGEHNGL